MSAFLYGIGLQWKLDLRNKGIIITYYVVPLIFFAFMGGIFTSINPTSKNTLIQSMTVFGVMMGAILGTPTPLVELYRSEIKKAYKVGGIPLWLGVVNNAVSAFIHLFIMIMVIYFAAPIVFKATVPPNIVLHFLSVAIFIAVALSVGTVLGLFVKDTSKLVMLSQLVFLPSIMLSGIMFPVELLPNALQTVGKIFPATWGYRLMTGDFNLINLLPLVIIFLVMVVASGYKLTKIKAE
jgi:ABC-2 type transport system permease protein